jgi:hypothetical protein
MTTVTQDIQPILRKYPNARRDSLITILAGSPGRAGVRIQGFGYRYWPAPEAARQQGVWRCDLLQSVSLPSRTGKFHVQVCRGTACHVKGSLSLLDTVKKELKLLPGQTSRDRDVQLGGSGLSGCLWPVPGDVCERRVLRPHDADPGAQAARRLSQRGGAVMTTMPKSLFAPLWTCRPRLIRLCWNS